MEHSIALNAQSIFSNVSIGISSLLIAMILLVLAVVDFKNRSWPTAVVSLALVAWTLGEAVRILPWGIGMWMAIGDERYHPLLIESRHLIYLPALPLILGGLWVFMYTVVTYKLARFALHVSLVMAVSLGGLAAATYVASQEGRWFDREAVVYFLEDLVGYPHSKRDDGTNQMAEDGGD